MKQVKNLFFILNIVGCQGVLQLGGPDLWYNQGDPAKVGACKSFLFTASSLVVKIRNTRVKTCFDSLAITLGIVLNIRTHHPITRKGYYFDVFMSGVLTGLCL